MNDDDRWERGKERRALVTFLRINHGRGILHFQRNDGGIEIGCSKHEDWELVVPEYGGQEGLTQVMYHLATRHAAEYPTRMG